MIKKTLMIFGPGGIGKSPLDSIVRDDVLRIDPYRLRRTGPRDKGDKFYANERIKDELVGALKKLGDECNLISKDPAIEWYPKSQVLFFQVRSEWQCLFCDGLNSNLAKAEIYAPVVPFLLKHPFFKSVFGEIHMIVLNPVEKLTTLNDFSMLQNATADNCRKRGDSEESIQKRIESIVEEATAWREILTLGGVEYPNWNYAEYKYKDDRVKTRDEVRRELIMENKALEIFIKMENEIYLTSIG